MIVLPAIDIYDSNVVRLYQGDYKKMTIYDCDPVGRAVGFQNAGATWLHAVDLEGARDGTTTNIEVVRKIVSETTLNVEIGGGIRSKHSIDAYMESGVCRIILGTAAVKDENLLKWAVDNYGESIAVGIDVMDGGVLTEGWREKSECGMEELFCKMKEIGVSVIICTDISKDGTMNGINRAMYAELKEKYDMNIIASGGVSSIDDIVALSEIDIYGAIIGKALYTGNINLEEAVLEVAKKCVKK